MSDAWIPLITPEQRERAAADIARLTPGERERLLIEVYARAAALGGDADRALQLGRDVAATVRLRGLPGYRELVDAPARRPSGPAVRVEDVLARLDRT